MRTSLLPRKLIWSLLIGLRNGHRSIFPEHFCNRSCVRSNLYHSNFPFVTIKLTSLSLVQFSRKKKIFFPTHPSTPTPTPLNPLRQNFSFLLLTYYNIQGILLFGRISLSVILTYILRSIIYFENILLHVSNEHIKWYLRIIIYLTFVKLNKTIY